MRSADIVVHHKLSFVKMPLSKINVYSHLNFLADIEHGSALNNHSLMAMYRYSTSPLKHKTKLLFSKKFSIEFDTMFDSLEISLTDDDDDLNRCERS